MTTPLPADFRCRSCGAADCRLVLDLGATPLANALLRADELALPEPRFPLVVVWCADCSLVQITETVPPELLFGDYVYFSSFSDAAVANAKRIAERLTSARALGADSLVVEIASNDGYLLRHYAAAKVPVLGVEPAGNIAAAAREAGIRTEAVFFGADVAQRLVADYGRADVVHANNVLAHVPDLRGFVRGLRALLKDEGVISIEVPYLKDLLDHVEFDTIYHEHLCYLSLTALRRLFASEGLRIAGVERLAIHGGSLRVFAVRGEAAESADFPHDGAAVDALLAEEAAWGVSRPETYEGFSARVNALKASLLSLLRERKASGRRIAAYGASAKGSTLLNTMGIGADLLDYVVDRSTVKQGRYTPGTHLAIYAPEKLLDDRPDDVLLLTWNFAEEILAQQAPYRAGGGNFIVPVPEPRVV